MVAAQPVSKVTNGSLVEFTSSNNSLDSMSDHVLCKTSAIKPSNIKKSKLDEKANNISPQSNAKKIVNTTNDLFMKSDNDDLATLSNLNEQIVLEQLKIRFTKNQIYVSYFIIITSEFVFYLFLYFCFFQ